MKKVINRFRHLGTNIRGFVLHESESKDNFVDLEEKDIDTSAAAHAQPLPFNTRMFVIFWFVGLLTVFAAYLIYQSLDFLYLLLAALIIAIALDSIIVFFTRGKFTRSWAIALTYLLFVVFLLAGVVVVIPFLVSQMSGLLEAIVQHVQSMQVILATQGVSGFIREAVWLPSIAEKYILDILADPTLSQQFQADLQSQITQLASLGTSYLQHLGDFAVSFVSGFVNFIGQTAIVLTFAVLFSIEKKGVMRVLASIGGDRNYNFAYAQVDTIYRKLGFWLKGQLILCVYIGIIVFVMLQILALFGLDLPSKGSLALIAGLTEFIPYLGPLLGGLPAVLMALVYFGIDGALVVLLAYWLIQRTENNVLIPYVMNKTLGISPILTLVTILIGGLTMGFLGVILGVPIAMVISLLLSKRFK